MIFFPQQTLTLQPSRITYDSQQLIAAAVWQEVAHGVPLGEDAIDSELASFVWGKKWSQVKGNKNHLLEKSSAPHILIHFKIIGIQKRT